jgi:uncharacterized protein
VRNILVFILFLIGLFYVRRALKGKGASGREAPPDDAAGVELMVPCAHCGVHVPESGGVRGAGGFFCSDEHRRLGPR